MAEYGLQIFKPSGQIIFDSRYAMGGVYGGQYTLDAGQSGTVTVVGDDVVGRSLRYHVCLAGGHDLSVGSFNGWPRLFYTARPGSSDRSTTVVLWVQ